jgi:hypothetical protein
VIGGPGKTKGERLADLLADLYEIKKAREESAKAYRLTQAELEIKIRELAADIRSGQMTFDEVEGGDGPTEEGENPV